MILWTAISRGIKIDYVHGVRNRRVSGWRKCNSSRNSADEEEEETFKVISQDDFQPTSKLAYTNAIDPFNPRRGRGFYLLGLQEPRWMLLVVSCFVAVVPTNSLISLCGKVVEYYRLLWSQDLRKKGWDFLHCSWIIPQFIFKHTHKRIADGYYCKCFVCKYIRGCAPGGYRTSTTQLQKTVKMKREENVVLAAHGMKNICTPHRELFFCEILTVVAMFVTTTTHAENKERNKLSISCFHSRKSAGMYEGGKWVPVRKTMK